MIFTGYVKQKWAKFDWHPKLYEKWKTMPPLREYLGLESTSRMIFGAGAGYTAWGHADRLMFEFVLARHRFDQIIEFGTWTGMSSLYFGMAAAMRRIPFWTCDHKDLRPPEVKKVWLWNMTFAKLDLLKTVSEEVVSRVSQENVLLIVDNGKKEKEAMVYGKHMAKGSVMIVHDWVTEVDPSLADRLAEDGYDPLYFEFAEYLASHVRVFIRSRVPWE